MRFAASALSMRNNVQYLNTTGCCDIVDTSPANTSGMKKPHLTPFLTCKHTCLTAASDKHNSELSSNLGHVTVHQTPEMAK